MMTAWLLIVVVFAVLYGYWLMLRFTFDLISKAHAELRERQRLEDSPPNGEQGSW